MTNQAFYRNLVGFLLLWTSSISYSQPVTKKSIDSTLKSFDPTYKVKRDVFYVVNGVLFDTLQLDTELAKYDLKKLVDLFFVPCEKIGTNECNNDVAVILFAYKQNSKKKRKALKAARELLKSNFENVVLKIDNSVIPPDFAKRAFNALHKGDIMYIDTAEKDNRHVIRIWKSD